MIASVWQTLPGWLTEDGSDGMYRDVRLLQRAARSVPSGQAIVEVGSWTGQSAFVLHEAAPDTSIYCYDPYPSDAIEAGSDGLTSAGALAQFRAAIAGHGNGQINLRVERGDAGGSTYSGPPVGLLHVDGDHRYESVLTDLRAWKPHLSAEAVVVLDDWEACAGVRMACREVFPATEWVYPARADLDWAAGRVLIRRGWPAPALDNETRVGLLTSGGNLPDGQVSHPWEITVIDAVQRAFARVAPITARTPLDPAGVDVVITAAHTHIGLATYGVASPVPILFFAPAPIDTNGQSRAAVAALHRATCLIPSRTGYPSWPWPKHPIVCYCGVDHVAPVETRRGLIAIGTQRPQKRAEDIAHALVGLPLAIVGAADDELRAAGAETGAVITGRLTYGKTLWRIAHSVAIVCNSSHEGFYLPAAEGALMGVPLIAPPLPVFVELWGDLPYYFDSPLEMRRLAEHVLSDPREVRARGDRMRARALELELTIDGLARRIVRITRQVVAEDCGLSKRHGLFAAMVGAVRNPRRA